MANHQVTHIGVLSKETIDVLRTHMENPELYRPIPLGIPELESIVGGIVLPSYVAIGGPAKAGKTTVTTSIVDKITAPVGNDWRMVIKNGVKKPLKIVYFHLEETKHQFAVRMLTMGTAKTTRSIIRDLQLTDEHFTELETRNAELHQHNIFMTDSVFTADEILKIAKEQDADIIVVDTFNLLDDRINGKQDESARLAQISRKFIKARNEDGITTIIAYQLNDMGKQLGTRSAYRDADLILEVAPAKDVNKVRIDGQLAIKVLPSRQSKGEAIIHVAFSGENNRITPLEKVTVFNPSTIEDEILKNQQEELFNDKETT